ncbi:MAG: hypothetical protein AAF631_01700 [Pseudomonadota bacterium]
MAHPAKVSVLKLDTGFPRVPGDVAAPETWVAPPEIITIPRATVAAVVHDASPPLAAFLKAAKRVAGQVATTSCGFLAPYGAALAQAAAVPFVGSALDALPRLEARFGPGQVLVMTYDATACRALGVSAPVLGLPPGSHLREVIAQDRPALDGRRAGQEVSALLATRVAVSRPAALLLECTNLPPYKAALREVFDGPIFDILTEVERTVPGTVRPRWR